MGQRRSQKWTLKRVLLYPETNKNGTHTQRNLFSHKKNEGYPTICDNVDEPGGVNEISQMKKTNTVWYHLHVESREKEKKSNFTETIEHLLPKGGDGRNGAM